MRFARAMAWVLLAVLAVCALLAGAAAWVLRPEALRQRLQTELGARLGEPVQVAALDYTWRDELTLDLRGVSLPVPGGVGGALQVGKFEVRTGLPWLAAARIAWAGWKGGAVEVQRVDLRDVQWQSADGASRKPLHLDEVLVLGLRKAAAGEEKLSATVVELQLETATVRLAHPAWTPAVTQFVVQVVPVNLRELLPRLGVALPPTASAQTFTRVGLQGACRVTPREWSCGTLQVQLDETTLDGSVARELAAISEGEGSAMSETAAPTAAAAWRFDLQADRLNLDDYLPPDDPRDPPFQVPWEMANAWPVEGNLHVGALQLAGLRMKDASVAVRFGAQGLVVRTP